jgi:hypothetical protein
MFDHLMARAAAEQGTALAESLARRYPVALDGQDGRQKVSVERISRILEGVYAEAQALQAQQRYGWFRRARLAHAFKWRLTELGYSKAFIDLATEGLIVYLHKPPEEQPERRAAEEKRARKAGRNAR